MHPGGPHYTLVMIEDDEGYASLIQKNLRRGGIAPPVVTLTDGAEALACFFGENADLPESTIPIAHEQFSNAIQKLGMMAAVTNIPQGHFRSL